MWKRRGPRPHQPLKVHTVATRSVASLLDAVLNMKKFPPPAVARACAHTATSTATGRLRSCEPTRGLPCQRANVPRSLACGALPPRSLGIEDRSLYRSSRAAGPVWPFLIRASAAAAYVSQCSALLFFAAARVVTASLLPMLLVSSAANVDGTPLDLSELLSLDPSAPPPLASRPPLRGWANRASLSLWISTRHGLRSWLHSSLSRHALGPR